MTSTPYQAYPDFPAGMPPQPVRPLPVELSVAGPVRQRRATVAFRLILIIPHVFVLFFLAIAASVVAFLGWWGALFTGYLPVFATDFLGGFARWSARVNAYLYLLTDAYPPFSLDEDPAYPVRLGLPQRQRLNRAAVFFRLILVIPAYIVTTVVATGTWAVSFIAWLTALVTGKLPTALHLANTASLRYQTRLDCYLLLLTPAYPDGLFGDPPVTQFAAAASPFADEYGSADEYGFTGPVSATVNWQLILTSSAKQLLVLFIVLGALLQGANNIRNAITLTSHIRTNSAIDQVNTAYNTLVVNAHAWNSALKACGNNVTCASGPDAQAALYFTNYATRLKAIPMPSDAADVAESQLRTDATSISAALTQLSQATTSAEYAQTYASTGLAQQLSKLDQDTATLDTALNQAR